MAEIVTIEGQEYKKRSPWGVWGLSLITIGIYYFVWYYKINDEARRYLRDETIKPVISVLAATIGALLIVPPYVSVYRTGERVVRIQERAGAPSRITPVIALVASLFFALHIPYIQGELNKAWDAATRAGSGQPALPEEPPGPQPPPPPPPAP